MAGTVLDSFVLEFNLDPSKFTAGQRQMMDSLRRLQETALSNARDVESSTKRTFDLLSSLRREALTTFSIIFGGREVGQMIEHITNLDAATGRFSRTLGLTANETGVWQGAIRQMGGSTESANAALRSMNEELVRLNQTGQSSILPVLARLGVNPYDRNHNLKTADQIFFDLSAAIERSGMDPRQAAGLLRMAGINDDMINLLTRGTRGLRELIDASRQAGTTTELSAAQAAEYQRQLALLDQSATNLGRNLLSFVLPAINAVTASLAKLVSSWNVTPGSPEDKAASATQREKLVQRFGSPRDFFNDKGGLFERFHLGDRFWGNDDAARDAAAARAAVPPPSAPLTSNNATSDYIRAAAAARGIDPNVALAVWASEGRGGYVGDHGTSFGPFQLHYGGGLGDIFTKQTGLHASDPNTQKQQIDFALDWAKTHGWSDWHGWRGSPFAGIGGGGGGVTVNVGGVVVNDQSGNADSIGGSVGGAISRAAKAGLANTGAQ